MPLSTEPRHRPLSYYPFEVIFLQGALVLFSGKCVQALPGSQGGGREAALVVWVLLGLMCLSTVSRLGGHTRHSGTLRIRFDLRLCSPCYFLDTLKGVVL